MSALFDRILQAIPESTYDLMGRVLPGGIVVAAIAVSLNLQMRGFTVSTDPGVLEIIVFAAFAYATGLAISTLTHPIHWVVWFLIFPILSRTDIPTSLENTLKAITADGADMTLSWKNPFKAEAVLDRAHDLIKQKSESERPIVTKLFAEVSLLYSLAIATTVAALLIGYNLVIPLTFLVSGVIRSLRTWHRHASILAAMSKQA